MWFLNQNGSIKQYIYSSLLTPRCLVSSGGCLQEARASKPFRSHLCTWICIHSNCFHSSAVTTIDRFLKVSGIPQCNPICMTRWASGAIVSFEHRFVCLIEFTVVVRSNTRLLLNWNLFFLHAIHTKLFALIKTSVFRKNYITSLAIVNFFSKLAQPAARWLMMWLLQQLTKSSRMILSW